MNGNHTALKSMYLNVNQPADQSGIVVLWENNRYHFAATHLGTPKEVVDALRMLADQIQSEAAFGLLDKLTRDSHVAI